MIHRGDELQNSLNIVLKQNIIEIALNTSKHHPKHLAHPNQKPRMPYRSILFPTIRHCAFTQFQVTCGGELLVDTGAQDGTMGRKAFMSLVHRLHFLEASVSIWKYLKASGCIWKHS